MHARDPNGDWLPVTVPSGCLRDAEAVPLLVRDRLKLFTGEWWEDPAFGNPVPEMLRSRRVTEADLSGIANALASFIPETDGVVSVSEVQISAEGRRISFSCRVLTAFGDFETVSAT